MQDEFPRCPICGSTDGYELSGILRNYAKCRICMAKWRLFVKDKQISEITLHELPKDGSSVYTISSTRKPLFTVLGKRLPAGFWRDLELDQKINWEFLSKNVSSDVTNAIMTSEGEKILHQWDGDRIGLTGSILQSGTLLLSTRRLCWLEKRKRGFWKQTTSFVVDYEIPLEGIKGITGDTGNSADWTNTKRICVIDSNGENEFMLENAFFETFRPMVEDALKIKRKEIKAMKKKERIHITLDFSFLKTYMEKGGLVMKVLKCPECGGTIEFPESGTQTKCTHCGKSIHAQDIFEKVKSLLE